MADKPTSQNPHGARAVGADQALAEDVSADVPVVMGRIRGAHGVRGLLRVQPYSQERNTLLGFATWLLAEASPADRVHGSGNGSGNGSGHGSGGVAVHGWKEIAQISGHAHGAELLVRLDGVDDRERAQSLRGREIAVWRSQLPALAGDEYYWSDLEGLQVTTRDGVELGIVERVFATGANDVLVVNGERERLIPFLFDDVVLKVDLDAAQIEVDWDPEF